MKPMQDDTRTVPSDKTAGVDPAKNLLVVARGAGISFFGGFVGQGVSFLSALVIARILGVHDYGLYALGVTVVTTVAALFGLGLATSCQRFVAVYRGESDLPRTKGAIVFSLGLLAVTGSLATVLFFIVSPFVAAGIFGRPELTSVLQVLALAMPFLSLTEALLAITVAFGTTKYAVLIENIFKPCFKLTLIGILALLGFRLGGVLAAYLVVSVAGFGFGAYYLNSVFPFAKSRTGAIYQPRALFAFGMPVFGSTILATLQGQKNVYLLGFLGTTEDIGIYNLAALAAGLIPAGLVALNSIFAPIISDLHNRRRFGELQQLFQSNTRWSLATGLPVFLSFALYGGPILSIFGPAFVTGAPTLLLLGLGQLVNAATGPVGYMVLMSGRSDVNLANELGTLVVGLALGFLLIPAMGLIGAALAATGTQALVNAIRLWEARSLLGMWPYGKGIWKPLAAGLAASGFSFLFSRYALPAEGFWAGAANIVVLVGIYAGCLWLLKPEPEDLRVAEAVKRRVTAAWPYRQMPKETN